MNSAEHYTTRYLETDDLDQYNALLRYTFQVTEEELTATGWKDDEIKQSKFPATRRKLRREILFSCIISSLFCFGAQISKALRAPSIKL